MTLHGFKDATTDPEQIRAWWKATPDANVAMPTGIVSDVIDIDVHKDGSRAALEALTGPLEPTFTVQTPHGGEHLHFVHREGVTNAPGGLPKSVDSRGLGGYVLLPPSKLADGRGYTVIDSSPVLPMPNRLFELLCPSGQPPAGPMDAPASAHPAALWVEKAVVRVMEGAHRNDGGVWLACQLRDAGLEMVDATPFVEEFQRRVQDMGDHPYTPSEAYASLRSAYSRVRREPARVMEKSSQFGTTALPPLTEASLTDVGNADRFASEYGDRLKHVAGLGWLAYDGRRWARGAEKAAQEMAKDCLRAMLAQARGLEDSRLEREVIGHVHRSMSAYGIKSMLTLATSDARMSASVDDFDTQPYLLNVRNGTVDLRDGSLREHRAADRLTHLSDVDFDPTALCPRFARFLEEIFPRDAELVDYLQRFVGYTATGEVREEKWLYASGSGSNGKGVLIRTLAHVLGDYAIPMAADVLTKSKYSDGGERTTPAFHTLPGKRFVYAQEPEGDALDEGRVKQLVSPDRMTVNPKHLAVYAFQPTHKLWLSANKRLAVSDTSNATWRRTIPVDFTESFTGREDWTLEPTLRDEASGILTWIVAGATLWYERGLGDLPTAVAETKKEYRAEQDPASVFFEDCLVPDASASVPLSEAAETYAAWWSTHTWATPIDPKNLRAFAKLARDHGVTVRKVGKNNATALVGYRRRTERTEDPQTFQKIIHREFGESQFAQFATADDDEAKALLAELEGRA